MLWAAFYYHVDAKAIFFNFEKRGWLLKEILLTLFDDIKR